MQEPRRLARMDKLQRAGRAFLMRLVAKHGLAGAARVLRALADELDGLTGAPSTIERRPPSFPGAHLADGDQLAIRE